jgi:Zn-dependent protease
MLGDPTAKLSGRLSFNPLHHIDPIGALCLFLFNFGWAKPVPLNPTYFRKIRRDITIVSLSGPLSNLLMGMITGLFIRYLLFPSEIYLKILLYMLLMNVGLGIFNLIPIPPLDGSHVLENLLPYNLAIKYRHSMRYAPFVLMGIIFVDYFMHTGIVFRLLGYPILFLSHIFAGDNLYLIFNMG